MYSSKFHIRLAASFIILLFTSSVALTQNAALSVHLWGNDNYKGDIIMKTLKVPHKTLYTYYCALMWNIGSDAGGYCGMQNHEKGNVFIFSLWDPVSSSEAIEAYYAGYGTQINRFGGEGTGLQSINFELGWAEGHDYQLAARAWKVGSHTFIGYWVNDISSKNWMHLVTMDYPVSNIKFDGSTGSFLEDWMDTGINMRKVFQKDAYKRKTDGKWYAFNNCRFEINTNDIGPGGRSYNFRNNYDAGVEEGYYFMQSGGSTSPSFSGTGTDLTNNFPSNPVTTPIDFYFTEANENKIAWTVPQSSTPQFRVKIEMNAEVVVDTVESEITSYPIQGEEGKLVFVTIEDLFGNLTKKSVSIGSANLAPGTPAGLKVDDSGSSEFTIKWDPVNGAEEYEIQIQKNYIWESAATTGSTTFQFTGLEERTRYRARVCAKNDFGRSAFTGYVWALTGSSGEAIIPNTNWTLHYVDSEETIAEDGKAVNAFDGDEDTFWHTEWGQATPSHPHEIQIDLGEIYPIKGFDYLPRQDGGVNGTIVNYEFYISNDGSEWGDPVVSGIFQKTTSLKEVRFQEIDGRYVRLVALTEINDGPWTSMAELSLIRTPVSGIEDNNAAFGEDYYLYEAYPNPFNPATNISFEVPGQTNVKISIYDMLGRRVAILSDKVFNAGKHTLKWNALNNSSGIYFCTIEAGVYFNTKKIVLLK